MAMAKPRKRGVVLPLLFLGARSPFWPRSARGSSSARPGRKS